MFSRSPTPGISDNPRHHDVKARVRVHEDPDGRIAVFHGPRRLATYGPDGQQQDANQQAA